MVFPFRKKKPGGLNSDPAFSLPRPSGGGAPSPSALETLLEASRALSAELDPAVVRTKVMETAARVTGAEAGSLLLLDEATGELVFDAASGTAGERVKSVRLKPGEGLSGWVAARREPLLVNDVAADPRWSRRMDRRTDFATRQVVAVPVLHQGRLLGVLESINKKGGGRFDENDRRLMELLAAEAGVALENARLFARLRAEKQTLAALFAEMSDGALVVDLRGRVEMINAAGARLLGISPAAAAGKSLTEAAPTFAIAPPWDRAVASPGPVPVEMVRAEGKKLILEGRLDSVRGGGAHLFVFRDVTEARREDRIKRDFLSLISHKLKTPLVSITGFAPLLLQDQSLTEVQRRGLTAIRDQGHRLWQLVERLLNFATVESDTLDLTPQRLSVAEVLSRLQKETQADLARRGARVVLAESLSELPPIHADPALFADAQRNLWENAAKFDHRPKKDIHVTGRAEAAGVVIAVEDGGAGIPSEEIPRLFKKFYQIEESFTGQVEGAGLGLALVQRIVEAHGGAVGVSSVLGRGSVFTTRWPRAD